MPGACCTRGLVCNKCEENAHEHTGTAGALRHSLRNGLTAYTRSPWRRIPLASIACGLVARIARLGVANLRRLDTSHGCQNHTVLPYASAPVVCTLCSLTDQGPPCDHDHAPDAAASTATRPNVRDDGQRPSTGTGWRDL